MTASTFTWRCPECGTRLHFPGPDDYRTFESYNEACMCIAARHAFDNYESHPLLRASMEQLT